MKTNKIAEINLYFTQGFSQIFGNRKCGLSIYKSDSGHTV